MNVVHDHPAAKWLPSRHRFALPRLVAYTMLECGGKAATFEDVDHIILSIDRDQSTIENYGASIWYLTALTCFIAAFVPLVLALPIALIVVEIPIYAFGLPFGNRRITSAGYLLCGAGAALYFATQPSWMRFVAYAFLGVMALNAIASVIMWLLRHRVRAAEERCVA
jgi:hypothetical protein